MVRIHMREHYSPFGAIQHLVIREDVNEVRTIGGAVEERGLDKWATEINS